VKQLCLNRRGQVRAAFVRAATPAQLPEMCDLNRKPRETVGRKVTELQRRERDRAPETGNKPVFGLHSHLLLAMPAGPPEPRISPIGKPEETLGRKAMGAKATQCRTQSQPGRRRNVNLLRKPLETTGRKARGLTPRPKDGVMSARPPEIFASALF